MNEYSPWSKKYRWSLISFCSLVILFVIHLPFLNADPDSKLGSFHDAFDAEGLSTIQLRNYINLGYLSITEGDKMVKMPLYNLILFLPLKIFGTHIIVARI